MVIGIVVTHGNLAEELFQTARQSIGNFSDCYAVSNEAKSEDELRREIEAICAANDNKPCVIFVDFLGGSCSNACMKLKTERANLCVISGVNLPLFLAFLNKRDEIPFGKLGDELVRRGHDSIKLLDPLRF